jgi:hypothetical protein
MGRELPERFLTAEWRYLAILNFEIEPVALAPLVPRGTELDSWQSKTLVSMVGFLFLDTRVQGLALPFHRNFEEVNLRFYVRRKTEDECRHAALRRPIRGVPCAAPTLRLLGGGFSRLGLPGCSAAVNAGFVLYQCAES